MTKIISFIGAPGCGKGFLIKYFRDRLSEQNPELNLQIDIISIGDMIRQEIKQQTALGNQIKESKKSGCLAPDKFINPLLKKRLYHSSASIIILDGYPRTMKQWEHLKEITSNDELNIVYRDTNENIIRNRIMQRRVCETCGASHNVNEGFCSCGGKLIKRKDDEFWEDRMEEYKRTTLPMIKKLKTQKNFYTLNIDNLEISENQKSKFDKYIVYFLQKSCKNNCKAI